MPGLTELNASDHAAADAFTAGREVSTSMFCWATEHQRVASLPFCGLNNPEVVHVASDHPSGLIDVTVDRKGPVSADPLWVGIAAFC